MRKCWLKIFLLSILLCAVFGSAGTAQAGSGVYPDSPRQIAPLDYGNGATTVDFTFAAYNSEFDTYFGFPVDYYLEVYRSGLLVANGYTGNTTHAQFNLELGSQYSWRVFAVYEFYDENADYAGIENSDWSPLVTFLNIAHDRPQVPEIIGPKQDLQKRLDVFSGGKTGLLWWWTNIGDLDYEVNLAKDDGFSADSLIDTLSSQSFRVFPNKLPADGSRIFWRVKARNAFGWGNYSQTESFKNDCYMASIGSGGSFSHIDSCSDDYTAGGFTGYLLKDISRRVDNDLHNHHGKMKKDAAIITGLESENLVNGEQKALGVQISPFQDADNKWGDLPFQTDAINAQVNTAGFYDYLLQSFMKPTFWGDIPLNSYDGNGSSMYNLIIDAPSCSSNYWYSGTRNAHFCPNNSRYPELVGHEWGHAVTGTASKRGDFSFGKYEEAGAMGEAFSDWIGMAYKQAICKSAFPSAANVKPLADCANLWLFQGWQDLPI